MVAGEHYERRHVQHSRHDNPLRMSPIEWHIASPGGDAALTQRGSAAHWVVFMVREYLQYVRDIHG